jgi:hypothetical protein
MLTQCGNDNFRIFAGHLDQHGKARMVIKGPCLKNLFGKSFLPSGLPANDRPWTVSRGLRRSEFRLTSVHVTYLTDAELGLSFQRATRGIFSNPQRYGLNSWPIRHTGVIEVTAIERKLAVR